MNDNNSSSQNCSLCSVAIAVLPEDEPVLCGECFQKSERIFSQEMRRIELIRTIRGTDAELYDIKHPDSTEDKEHCGQMILLKAGSGFEVKICIRPEALDWMKILQDEETGFESGDRRLDALIGNVSLLIESWGGGPFYLDIFFIDQVISTEAEV